MQTTRLSALFVLLSVTLAEEVQLKYKPSTKPVRLFTEEELKRYDGREVERQPSRPLLITQSGSVIVVMAVMATTCLLFSLYSRWVSLFTWQSKVWFLMSAKEKVIQPALSPGAVLIKTDETSLHPHWNESFIHLLKSSRKLFSGPDWKAEATHPKIDWLWLISVFEVVSHPTNLQSFMVRMRRTTPW